MGYDFHTVHQRKQTRSYKWDMADSLFQGQEILPMWVADMDFMAPPEVNEALLQRVQHGIYGYTVVDGEVKGAISAWLEKRYGWSIQEEWLVFSPGVITSLSAAIQALTEPGDPVLIQPPVYPPFYDMVRQNGRQLVTNPLFVQEARYQIDFDDFEQKLRQGVKLFILCSPHNPVGRVWTKEELLEMAQLCLQYGVTILSDEIHADIIFPGYRHIPIASLSKEIARQTVTFMSPSKSFNLAGLQASYIIAPKRATRLAIKQQLRRQGLKTLNVMGITALEAAYTKGEPWLTQLIEVLNDHKEYVTTRLEREAEPLKVIRSEGTYLQWIDCRGLGLDDRELAQFMVNQARVGLNPGVSFGPEGRHYMRLNFACPRSLLAEGINRIVDAVNRL